MTTPSSTRYPDRPVIGIGIVIWRGDKVLLIKRRNPPRAGEWSLPGGKQNVGETIIDAALREAREETGLDVTPIGIITALDGITRDATGKVEYHYTIIDVAAESATGTPCAADDATDVCWATLNEIPTLCPWQEVARVVRLSAQQRLNQP